MNIAFIGLGAVGQEVLRCLRANGAEVHVLGALVAHPERSRACGTFATLEELLGSDPDLVIECARQQVLQETGARVLSSGTSLIVSSVGALADEKTHDAFKGAGYAGGAQTFVPAGAIPGIDALAAARHVGLATVRYTRRAPPSTWQKSGMLGNVDTSTLDQPLVLFEGTAREAARRYPKNANVAATIALAGIGFERTRVTLLADPSATSNVHLLEAEGEFGTLRTEMSACPISADSTSSKIVAGSLARAILSRVERIVI